MASRDFIGIELSNQNEWIVVKRAGTDRTCQRFRDSPTDMAALMTFLRDRCTRPKICLKAAGDASVRLVGYLGGIPDAEVLLISDEGLQVHKARLASTTLHPYMQGSANAAETLARCAERLI
jgi:hypothetical protein